MSSFKYTPENEAKFQEYASRYPKIDSCMLPALWLVQEQEGWVSPEAMVYVAEKVQKSPMQVYEVATFYTMFNMKPVGKYVLEVCRTGPCMLNGSDNILDHIRKKLNIKDGGTSEDGLFTLKPAECLGACGYAPMMQLGKFYHENLTIEKVDEILDLCRQGAIALD